MSVDTFDIYKWNFNRRLLENEEASNGITDEQLSDLIDVDEIEYDDDNDPQNSYLNTEDVIAGKKYYIEISLNLRNDDLEASIFKGEKEIHISDKQLTLIGDMLYKHYEDFQEGKDSYSTFG